MRLTFLGTAAANAFPEPFCSCANCNQARRMGGKSLRRRSAALVDSCLLIDLGPDILSAANAYGINLTRVEYCLQTHAHADHLDPSHFLSRSPGFGVVGAPRLNFYASKKSIHRLASDLTREFAPDSLIDKVVQDRLNIHLHPIEAAAMITIGSYQVMAFPANHDSQVDPLIFGIRSAGRSLLYATDTAQFPDDVWILFEKMCWCFDLVVLDHTYGPDQSESDHLNADQVVAHMERMRKGGWLHPKGRVFATHIAHEGNPAHPQLVAYAHNRGYAIAYDGLTVQV